MRGTSGHGESSLIHTEGYGIVLLKALIEEIANRGMRL